MSGTSMACPHVAGAAALIIARARPPGTGAGFVANVRAALLAAAVPQASAEGFIGAPASSTEPLLHVGRIGVVTVAQ
jgi:subtilisin family serine protease